GGRGFHGDAARGRGRRRAGNQAFTAAAVRGVGGAGQGAAAHGLGGVGGTRLAVAGGLRTGGDRQQQDKQSRNRLGQAREAGTNSVHAANLMTLVVSGNEYFKN